MGIGAISLANCASDLIGRNRLECPTVGGHNLTEKFSYPARGWFDHSSLVEQPCECAVAEPSTLPLDLSSGPFLHQMAFVHTSNPPVRPNRGPLRALHNNLTTDAGTIATALKVIHPDVNSTLYDNGTNNHE